MLWLLPTGVCEEEVVAVKKAKRPALRYLLSADPRLHKLSLKKLVERRKKSAAPKRAARTKTTSRRVAESLRWPWTADPGAVGLAGIGILAAATLFAAGQMSDRSDSDNTTVAPAWEARLSAPAPATPSRVEKLPAPSKPRASESAKSADVKPAPAKLEMAKPEAAKPEAARPAPVATVAKTAAVPEPTTQEPVTITGCLAKNNDKFWLKDAAGAELSKSRSWRTGFFKKSAPRVDVVAGGGMLSSYVGHRVAATGVLTDHELRARSVRSIARSCS